jgi:Kef-type K+ transport system membrane component KefB/Trk K+ transport system NAD-binding subunit
MVEEVLISLSLILAIAAIATVIARLIRQPPIIAYIIAGILAGPLFFNIIGAGTTEFMQLFAHIGVAFLLFIVGLNLDLRVLKEVGWVSLSAGFVQVILTALLGYFLSIYLGFSNLTALYLGIVLSFSSTVVVIKILSDRREIDTLHGRISLGILIIQDFIAAIALMMIPLIYNSHGTMSGILVQFSSVVLLVIVIFFFAHFILNKILNYIAVNHETLFLFGIAWALVLATIFFNLGFSLEIGALVAGMSIASSKYHLELGGKIKPLRDFFIVLFFVFFGSQLLGPLTKNLLITAVIFSLFVIILKPLIVMFVLRFFGYRKKTNFFVGISLAQISEFSLILVLLGLTLGHLNQEIISLIVLIALITIGFSSYTIHFSISLFNKMSFLLNIFEGKKHKKEIKTNKESYDVILFGYHRIGYKLLNSIKDLKSSFAVVDFNPKVVLSLAKKGISTIYGDAGSKDFLRELPLNKAKIIISTIPDLETNMIIKERLKELNHSAVFIATTEQPIHALDLYKVGVDYVILPHHLGGDFAAHMIKSFQIDKSKYKQAGKNHKQELKKAKNNSLYYSGL